MNTSGTDLAWSDVEQVAGDGASELGRLLAGPAPAAPRVPVSTTEAISVDDPAERSAAVAASTPATGVRVGRLIAFDAAHRPLVTWPGQHSPAAVRARAILPLDARHIGAEVVLQFDSGDAARPIVMGVLQLPSAWPVAATPEGVQVEADGRRLVIEASEEITLRCGAASLTLTRAGKILLQGEYVSQRANGVMRIRGGSVQLN